MTDDSRKFVIVCPARSGSTMLVHLLRSHPDCVSNGEVMAMTDSLGGFDVAVRAQIHSLGSEEELVRWRRHDPIDFMEKVALYGGGSAWAGYKIKSDELVRRRYQSVLKRLTSDPELRIFHLNRRNLLERYVSWVMVNKVTGVTMATKEEDRPEFSMVKINPRDAEKDFLLAEKREGLVDEWFADSTVLSLAYEDLVADPERESERICSFLDIEQRLLTTRTLKITPHVSTLISNFEDLQDYFAGGRFEYLFELPPPEPDPEPVPEPIAVNAVPDPAPEPCEPEVVVSPEIETPAEDAGRPEPAVSAASDPSEPEDAPLPAFVLPEELFAFGGESWPTDGASYLDYLAAVLDVTGFEGRRLLGVGRHRLMIQETVNGRSGVERYTAIDAPDALIEFCEQHLDGMILDFHAVDLNADAAEWPDLDLHDAVIFRAPSTVLAPERAAAVLSAIRSRVATGSPMLLEVALSEPSTAAGGSLWSRFGGTHAHPEDHVQSESEVFGATHTFWSRAGIIRVLGENGWQVDAVFEPRATMDFHLACSAADAD